MSVAISGAFTKEQKEPVPFRTRLMGILWFCLLRLQAATWSVHTEGLSAFDAALEAGQPVLLAFWHGKYLPLFPLLRGRQAVIFSSLSPRGRVIAEICRHFGYQCTLLADHGREESLNRMRRALAGANAGGIAADGPLGPRHAVKRGAVILASEQGRALYPVSTAASRKKILAERWDQMEIPGLFSRIALVVGPAIEIPAGVPAGQEGPWQERIHEALEGVDARADALVLGP